MAQLEFNQQNHKAPGQIQEILSGEGIHYECWGLRDTAGSATDDGVLSSYAPEIRQLQESRGYVEADLVALRPDTENLGEICAKFSRVHHHTDDEVRFVVEGAGVFEIQALKGDGFFKITATPGDLIVIPANRRHFFYLTEEKNIRCIRLFKDNKGWEAIY